MFYHRNLPPLLLLLTLSVVLGSEQPEKGQTKENKKKKKKCNGPQKAEAGLEAPSGQGLLSQQEHAGHAQQILLPPAICPPFHSALTMVGSKASMMSCESLSVTNVPSSLVCVTC